MAPLSARSVALAAAGLLAGGAGAAAAADPALSVSAALSTRVSTVGDRVTGTVTVAVDGRLADPASLRVAADLSPLTEVAPATESRTQRGQLLIVRYRAVAACLTAGCVPDGRARRIALSRVRVEVVRRDRRAVTAAASWPQLTIGSRVTPAQAAATKPPFRRETAVSPPTYAADPGLAAALLDAAAGLLGAVALAWAARRLARLRRERSRAPALTGLARALQLARESTLRPPADRRRALGLLARLLAARAPELAVEADGLAWAPPPPAADAVCALVDEVGEEVGEQ